MKVAIIQSNYIPWKGYFDIIRDVDLFVFYDDVQYTVRDWRNRNKIKGRDGELWLTVPVPADSRDLDAEWGPSSGDVRHRLYGFVRTRFPHGVSANLWADAQSGAPYTVRTGFDDNRDTIFNDRPAGVGRNTERGTWQRTVNIRLSWQPGAGASTDRRGGRGQGGGGGGGKRRGVEIYAQVWNLLNETNFTRFAGVLTSPFYGSATSAAPARRFDFGIRTFF